MPKDDPVFEGFLNDLSSTLQEHGIEWLGRDAQKLVRIVLAIAKMRLPRNDNPSVMKIMMFIGDDKTATWLFENGDPQRVAKYVWAFAKF